VRVVRCEMGGDWISEKSLFYLFFVGILVEGEVEWSEGGSKGFSSCNF
jgi:hypothetical protein